MNILLVMNILLFFDYEIHPNVGKLELFNPKLSTRLSQVRSFGFINH